MRDTTSPDVPSTRPTLVSASVLIVDDESGIRDVMRRWLKAAGCSVTIAPDADTALEVMETFPRAVVVCDIRMPGRDGLWLAARIRRQYPETAVMMATSAHDVPPAVASLRCGVVDYLTKPFGRERLLEAVERGVAAHQAACESRQWREELERDLRTRYARLAEAVRGQPIASDEAVDALLCTLTGGDREAYAHAYRVAALAAGVARTLDFAEDEVAIIERGALLHDLGKLAMPEALLRKPAALTRDEQEIIRRHPALASALLADVPYLAAAADVVRDAHERLDGLGFPNGSRGDAVWLGARIVTVADSYDTMTRPRTFRDALSPAEALAELDRCTGTQFDGRVVAAFKRVLGA